MEHQETCGFDIFFRKNLPHILENIFLSLDYQSFKTCYEVSNEWKEFITSDTVQWKAKDQFSSEIEDDEMSLSEASNLGNAEEIRSLLSYGLVDVNYVGWIYVRTALHEASERGHIDAVKVLLDHGADPNIVDEENGQTPLHLAAVNNYKEVTKALLDKGAQPNKADENGETPLIYVVFKGLNDIVKILLDGGADPNQLG